MSIAAAPIAASGNKPSAEFWRWAVLALGVCLLAVSAQSVWVDEAFMAEKARQPTLHDWWRVMLEQKGSDLQMPLYMIYMWGYVKIFGLGEWALRAANIPWFVAGAALFISSFPRPQRFAIAAVTLACPFAWYYLNEARPYTMQLGAAMIIFGAIYRLKLAADSPGDSGGFTTERYWVAALGFGVIALCGSSLLGVIWAGAAGLCLPFLFTRAGLIGVFRRNWLIAVGSLGVLIALGLFYRWTLKIGAQSTGSEAAGGADLALGSAVKAAARFRTGFAGGTDLRTLGFLGYELGGFAGLGPGRLEIRTAGLGAFRPFIVPLVLYGACFLYLMFTAASQAFRNTNLWKAVGLALAILVPGGALLAAGYFLGFQTLGRHFTPMLPAIIFLLGVGLIAAWMRGQLWSKAVAMAYLALAIFSCYSLRVGSRHQKDDYRGAAKAATAALGQHRVVWWTADEHAAEYYGIPLNPRFAGDVSKVIRVQNIPPDELALYPAPDEIILSRPDSYDSRGTVVDYLTRHAFEKYGELRAFTVWRAKTKAVEGEFH